MLYGRSDGGLRWLQNLSGTVRAGPALASGVGDWTFRLVGLVGNVGSVLLKTLFVVAVALMVAAQPIPIGRRCCSSFPPSTGAGPARCCCSAVRV